MLKLASKASSAFGRSSHMGVFETLEIQKDLKALLSEFQIPIQVYQRLEFLFRQALMQSPATSLEYSHFEELIDFKSQPSSLQVVDCIDESLEHWHLRYRDREYGFCRIEVSESGTKDDARRSYRKAMISFNEVFANVPSKGLKESWLRELSEKLRFHVVSSKTDKPRLNGKDADYLTSYLGIAEAIYHPFFIRHFENRRLTTERYFEFLALKLSVEAGEFIVPQLAGESASTTGEAFVTSDSIELASFAEEPARLQMLPPGWLDHFSQFHREIDVAS